LEWHVEQVVAVDFDDAVAEAEAAVLVDAATRLYALHQEASVLAQSVVVGHHVDSQWTLFISQCYVFNSATQVAKARLDCVM
jgi:hypothetical protein